MAANMLSHMFYISVLKKCEGENSYIPGKSLQFAKRPKAEM